MGELDKHTDVPRALGGPVQMVWRVSASLSELLLQAFSSLSLFFFFLNFWLHNTACGILVPRPGIKPTCPALEAQSLNHWTTREIPSPCLFTFGPSLLLWPLADAELLMILRDPPWLSSLTSLLSLPQLFQPLPRSPLTSAP